MSLGALDRRRHASSLGLSISPPPYPEAVTEYARMRLPAFHESPYPEAVTNEAVRRTLWSCPLPGTRRSERPAHEGKSERRVKAGLGPLINLAAPSV